MTIASVDGCKRGWLVAKAAGWPLCDRPSFELCEHFSEVLKATSDCELVLVDMPIGLPQAGHRECDAAARAMLASDARGRVFYAPPRPTLDATGWEAFKQLHRKAQGKGLSRQAFGLLRKIREVDDEMQPDLQDRIREFHPELVWRRLAGETLPSKHTAAGILTRMRLLERELQTDETWGALSDADVAAKVKIDDLLDAPVGLAAAEAARSKDDPPFRIPTGPVPVDGCGLRMEMWH